MGSGIMTLVSKADRGQYMTITQVAEKVGRSTSQIKSAIRSGKVAGPTHRMTLGDGSKGAFVWLYTDVDVRRLRKYFRDLRPGPKKVERKKTAA